MRDMLFRLLAFSALAAILLTACATPTSAPVPANTPAPEAVDPPQTDSTSKVKIRWFVGLGTGTDANQLVVEEKVVEAFNASHPNIDLVLEVVHYDTARDTLATEMASGNAPDLVGPVGVSGAEAFHGMWLDLSDLIEKHSYDLSQFDEGAVAFYKVGGEGQIGLPFAIFPSMLYYQREMFDEAGLSYPPHAYGEKYTWPDGSTEEWTFETLRKLALALTVDSNGNDATSPDFDATKIVQYGYEPQYQDLRAVGSYFGADTFVATDGKTAQIPDQWVAAWDWVYNGIWDEHFIPNQAVRDSTEYGSGNPFNSGKVAMAITHLWYTCCVVDAGADWDVAAVPAYNGVTTANFNADTFRILKSTQHPDEAFEVLSYLIGEASLELLAVYGGMPARTQDQDAFFKSLDEQFPQDVDWQVAIDGIAYADNPSFEGYMPNYNESFDLANTFLSTLMSTEGLDIQKAVATFQKDLQTVFDKKQ